MIRQRNSYFVFCGINGETFFVFTEGWIILELDLNGINADSLVQMLRASFTLENWDGILQIADRLYSEINQFYSIYQREHADGQKVCNFGLNRSIVYYFGYSMCLKGIALEKLGRYDEARECISKYEDLGWINGMNAEGRAEVEYYCEIALANLHVIELNEGTRPRFRITWFSCGITKKKSCQA